MQPPIASMRPAIFASIAVFFAAMSICRVSHAQTEPQETPAPARVSVSAIVVGTSELASADRTRIASALRRGAENSEGVRFSDVVDLLSSVAVPDNVQNAIDALDSIAERLRAQHPPDVATQAWSIVDVFEHNLLAVKRTQLFDAVLLGAIADCRAGRARKCLAGMERALSFRESAQYDTARYPSEYEAQFESVRQRLLVAQRFTLAITTDPVGAEIFVDGQSVGPSPADAPSLLEGAHYVTVKLVGYEKMAVRVEVGRQDRNRADLHLVRSDRALLLVRDVDRVEAELGEERAGPVITGLAGYLFVSQIIFADVKTGETSLYVYDLRTHFLLAKEVVAGPLDPAQIEAHARSLYERVDRGGAIASPTQSVTEERIEPSPPIWKKWWFWTAIGVVAASATATGVALAASSHGGTPDGFTRVGASIQ